MTGRVMKSKNKILFEIDRCAECLLSLAVMAIACFGTNRVVYAEDTFATVISQRDRLLMGAGWKFHPGDLIIKVSG